MTGVHVEATALVAVCQPSVDPLTVLPASYAAWGTFSHVLYGVAYVFGRQPSVSSVVVLLAAVAGAFVVGMRSVRIELPSYHQLTFRRGWVESSVRLRSEMSTTLVEGL